MIGDTCMDMDAARNAGIVGVGVLCGYGTKEMLEECVEYLVEDAREAVAKIQGLA